MAQNTVYEERSGWPWWVHLLILGCSVIAFYASLQTLRLGAATGTGGSVVWVAVLSSGFGVMLPALFYLLMGDLRTRVTDRELFVSFGLLEVIRKRILYGDIEEVRAVTYGPLREFGGWGIRLGGGGKLAWTVRGNRAVRIDLAGGKTFFLGSDRPERVVQWIRTEMRRG